MLTGRVIRSLLRNLALTVLVLAVVTVAMEVVLRTTHVLGARRAFTQPDPVIGWRFTAGASYWHKKENDHAISGRINQHGWRDREHLLEKSRDVFRVAVLGDSYVEAMQVELDSTFLAVVERERRGRVELINLARSGMTQTEELLVLQREAAAYDPDAVALFFFPLNDIDDANPETADTRMRPFFFGDNLELDTSFSQTRAFRLRNTINPLKQRSALVSLVAERYNVATRARRGGRDAGERRLPAALTLCTSQPDARAASSYALCKRLLAECARLTRESGIRLVLVGIAVAYDGETESRMRGIDPTFDPDFFDRDLRLWADNNGVDYVGLQKPFREQSGGDAHALQWAHWNYSGHRLVARVFGQWLDGVTEN